MASRERFGGSFGSTYGVAQRTAFSGSGATGFGSSYRDEKRSDGYRGPQKSANKPVSNARKRSRSPARRGDSNRRNQGSAFHSRYEVTPSLYDFKTKEIVVTDIKKRYTKMYIPSDFFNCDLRWLDCFLPHKSFPLGSASSFHIFHKEVEHPDALKELDDPLLISPPDADYAFSAKVMLLSSTDLPTLYQHTIRVADEEFSATAEKLHWMRQFHFLVGTKGKSEVMAIGGPWSPSLDGEDPAQNPEVLINTAIRTCRAQTGIDLSQCTRWHKFVELHYFRPAERVQSAKTDQTDAEQQPNQLPEPRVETVVIFFPDVHNCMPSNEEWVTLRSTYKELLEKKISQSATTVEDKQATEDMDRDNEKAADETNVDAETSLTHYSKLDVSTMKVAELREQLDARKLDSKGLKSQLVTKLETALKDEERQDKGETVEAKEENESAVTEPGTEAVPTVELSEKDRRRLERLYRLDETKPSIIVHPSHIARGGKFDCEKLSLSTLLDYRLDDQKEHTFEVSLFAEQFRDMIIRDCSFNIYKALVVAPEPPAVKEAESEKIDGEEPDSKRRRGLSTDRKPEKSNLPRTVKRTVDPQLLFSFAVFDTGHAGYIKEEDLEKLIFTLGLNLSRSQIRKLILKVTGRKADVSYRSLTDKDVIEGDVQDVVHLRNVENDSGPELFMGNRAFFEEPADTKVHESDLKASKQIENLSMCEAKRVVAELSFGEMTAEIGRTEKLLKDTQESKDRFGRDIIRLSDDLTEDRQRLEEISVSNSIYNNLLKAAFENLTQTSTEIQSQFAQEKAVRDAEEEAKRLAEEERKKALEESVEKENVETEENGVETMDMDAKENAEKPEDFTVLDSA